MARWVHKFFSFFFFFLDELNASLHQGFQLTTAIGLQRCSLNNRIVAKIRLTASSDLSSFFVSASVFRSFLYSSK